MRRVVRLVLRTLYLIAFGLLDRVVFLNDSDPVDLLGRGLAGSAKVSVLGGIGVELDQYPFAGPRLTCVTFIFVGRLMPEKGIEEFLAAAAEVKAIAPASRFVVLGATDAGAAASRLEKALFSAVNAGVVVSPGQVSNVYEWLADSTVFVLPSYYREGVPRSTQEALAVGLPVITTNMPGCRDTVIDGVNGYLIPPWRADLLAERMLRFVRNPDLAVGMGRASRDMAERRFDVLTVNERLKALILPNS